MSPETRLEFPGGDLGDCDAGDYERAFAGVENTIEELSGKSVPNFYLNQCSTIQPCLTKIGPRIKLQHPACQRPPGLTKRRWTSSWAMTLHHMISGGPHFQLRIKQVSVFSIYLDISH